MNSIKSLKIKTFNYKSIFQKGNLHTMSWKVLHATNIRKAMGPQAASAESLKSIYKNDDQSSYLCFLSIKNLFC